MKKEKKTDTPVECESYSLRALTKIAKASFELLEREMKAMKSDNLSTFKLLQSHLKDHHELLLEMAKVNQSCEETLLNVLHAIRQNEYLQAYYPAQRGYPDMTVVGQHPLNLTSQESL